MNGCRNTLKEAVLKYPEFGEQGWKDPFLEKARSNAVYRRVVKEYVLTNIQQAPGKVHDIPVESADLALTHL